MGPTAKPRPTLEIKLFKETYWRLFLKYTKKKIYELAIPKRLSSSYVVLRFL